MGGTTSNDGWRLGGHGGDMKLTRSLFAAILMTVSLACVEPPEASSEASLDALAEQVAVMAGLTDWTVCGGDEEAAAELGVACEGGPDQFAAPDQDQVPVVDCADGCCYFATMYCCSRGNNRPAVCFNY